MNQQLRGNRYYRNSHEFSSGHVEFLPNVCKMFDIDSLLISASFTIRRQDEVFVEYREEDHELIFKAVFSLKHKQAQLSRHDAVESFCNDISHRAMRAMCRKLGARLFLVFHADKVRPPFEFYEIDTRTGVAAKRGEINYGEPKEAWLKMWRDLGLTPKESQEEDRFR